MTGFVVEQGVVDSPSSSSPGGVFPVDGSVVMVSGVDDPGGSAVGWLVVDFAARGAVSSGSASAALAAVVKLTGGVFVGEIEPGQVSAVVDGPELPEGVAAHLEWVLGAVFSERRAREAEAAEREQWLAGVVSDAMAWADDHDMCERFDQFMTEHGLASRRRQFMATVDARLSVRVEVPVPGPWPSAAAAEAAATAAVTPEMVARTLGRRVGGFRRFGLAVQGFEVAGVEAQ
ncbi:hypothetical protein OG921_23940 [Aldersonia sp. NBC_00410]|uniref:hypothetical protein n=1 Tax=Aldersonia sp. NBC_00410 TaxID=2975954 RepID=UPI0022527EB6|nr:hypothetical protein [Aldersonia sp. NBC_00410]MCX5046227.1 hypothetical protein [Aldersonia sp. NBC_00410]